MRGETLWSRLRRRIKRARRVGGYSDVADPGCFLDLDDLAILVVLVVVILLLVFFVIPLLLVLLDALFLIVLLLIGIGARVAFRRPWVVEATDAGPLRYTWRIVGWKASGEKVDQVADLLAYGHDLPPGYEVGQRPGA